jgi:hypothetical protein
MKLSEQPSSSSQASSDKPAQVKATKEDSNDVQQESSSQPLPQPLKRSVRLFGSFMNSAVTYEDATSAWIVIDDIYSRMSSTVYERIAGGAHYAGRKVIRGFRETAKKAETADSKAVVAVPSASKGTEPKEVKEMQASEEDISESADMTSSRRSIRETPRQALERQMSNLVSGALNADQEEEEVRKRNEQEIREDYNDDAGDNQGREIEHLILATHGIGQRLGLRLESVNFVHDVNTLRKTMKAVYSDSTDLQALNGEVDKDFKNSRVQVLPVCWRHLLDFPKQSLKANRKEHDITETVDDDKYPTLEDITVEGAPAIRNLITDLGLDILLYQSPVYKAHITRIVLDECNRTYKLFKRRNPGFKGKVSLLGHSLGSAVMFDILCNQKVSGLFPPGSYRGRGEDKEAVDLQLDFDVEDFYAFGSPIGLFQMLKGRRIAARHTPNVRPAQTPFDLPPDPFASYMEITTSSPKCRQIFNIFHPTDPVAYRMEPLISSAMATLHPQQLPYTKKGIFGAPVGQGISGLGARVGQSVSGWWSSISSGIADNLVNRSLGISTEEASRLGNKLPHVGLARSLQAGETTPSPDTAQTNAAAAATAAAQTALTIEDAKRLVAQGSESLETGVEGENPPTLLNANLETLFSGFQKAKEIKGSKTPGVEMTREQMEQADEEAKMVKREEDKVRGLNKNGRVDYSIQE